jgi:very-short-patch-repair endonuclease
MARKRDVMSSAPGLPAGLPAAPANPMAPADPARGSNPAAALERAVLQLAARQHSVVTRPQLLHVGLSPATIDRRLAAARLTAVHRGVYRVGPPVAPRAREMAAVLACGGASALARGGTGAFLPARAKPTASSHGSAADLLRIVPGRRPRDPVEVSVQGSYRSREGILIHRVRFLPAGEITWVEGIPVTTPARTILDLAGSLPGRELERAVAEAIALRGTTSAALLALARSRRHALRPGVHRVRALLAGDTDPARTRSVAEERFLELVRTTGLPEPETNVRLGRYEVDFLWRALRLVVEIDGFVFHSAPGRAEADRRRDADLEAAGYHVLRFTWRELQNEPMVVLARLCRAMGKAEGRGKRTGRG